MAMLTEHQQQALDAYRKLMARWPSLFEGRAARPIVRDREVLAAYACNHNIVLGAAAETPYFYFIVDLVQSISADGSMIRHPYLRVVSRKQLEGGINVVVLATIENPALGSRGDIVLIEQERHSLGTSEIEVPRGFGEPGLSGEANALRELQTETGYVGDTARLLGRTYADSGLTDGMASYYHVPVMRRTAQCPELQEAIREVQLISKDEVWEAIRSGTIRDGFTLQALFLYKIASERVCA